MVPRLLVYDHLDQPLFEIDPEKVYGLTMVEKVNGEHSLTITTSQELEKGQRIFYADDSGKVREFVVTGDSASHDSGFKHVYYCVWSLMSDLSGGYIEDRRIGNKNDLRSVDDILQVIADSGRWEVGTVSCASLSSAWLYYTTAWDALGRAVEQWSGEVDSTVVLGNPVVRMVDFYSKQGDQEPKRRFDYGHDLTSIKRTVLDDLYVCRILPRGKGELVSEDPDAYGRRITIESVNPTGEEWLQDDDAAALVRLPDGNGGYDYPTQIVIYESVETPQALYDTALADLETYTRPKVSYEASVLALSGAGMEVSGVELGDAVQVVDRTFGSDGLRLSARVLGIERNLLDPSNDKLTIGNFQPLLSDAVKSLVNGLSAAQEQLIDTDGKADTALSDASTATQIAVEAQAVANATGQHFWDDTDGAHVTEVTKSEWNDSTGSSYHSGANSLWNSLGMLFRKGLTNLLSIVTGDTTGVAIYDGIGNSSSNIVSSFTSSGVTIGRESKAHTTITTDATTWYNTEGEQVGDISQAASISFTESSSGSATIDSTDGVRKVEIPLPGKVDFTNPVSVDVTVTGFGSNTLTFEGYQTAAYPTRFGTTSRAVFLYIYIIEGGYDTSYRDVLHIAYASAVSAGTTLFSLTYSLSHKYTRYGARYAFGTRAGDSGMYSFTAGESLEAAGENQTALGRYNVSDTTSAIILGNGTSDSARSNALTVDFSGNVSAEGRVTAAGLTSEAANGYLKSTNITDGTAPSANTTGDSRLVLLDSAGSVIGWLDPQFTPTYQGVRLYATRTVNGTAKYNAVILRLDSSGNAVVTLDGTGAAAAWRNALSAAAAQNQSTQNVLFSNFTGATQLWGIAANCINANNTAQYGNRQSIVFMNEGILGYDNTNAAVLWQLTGMSGTLSLGTTTTTTVSSVISMSTNWTCSATSYAQWGRTAQLYLTVKCSTALSANTMYTIGTLVSGKRPATWVGGSFDTSANIYGNVMAVVGGGVRIRPTASVAANTSITVMLGAYILA